MTHQGKTAVVEDAFADTRSPKGSGANTPARSRLQTPIGSANGTPAGSGEDDGSAKVVLEAGVPIRKKKKLTRNQLKAQEERRRLRKLRWLQFGGPRPEDTDSDVGP
jgi:elongation factor 3